VIAELCARKIPQDPVSAAVSEREEWVRLAVPMRSVCQHFGGSVDLLLSFFQDSVHVCNNIRCRVMWRKPDGLPFGRFKVSMRHFERLNSLVAPSVFQSNDKMDFKVFLDLCRPEVWTALGVDLNYLNTPPAELPETYGTGLYFFAMYCYAVAFLGPNVDAADRAFLCFLAYYIFDGFCLWAEQDRRNRGITTEVKKKTQGGPKGMIVL